MPDNSTEQLAERFKALGHPARLRLVALLAASLDGEVCLCDLTSSVGLTQPTVTHHMKRLVACALVKREQRGKWAYFSLVEEHLPGIDAATLGGLAQLDAGQRIADQPKRGDRGLGNRPGACCPTVSEESVI
ncbi:MAG: metalloregulator ArsR/SmtB family transcription factor [Bifidobacteriaceae bacterium]|jgi:DNA-binding transcriptional ArsR family regulator|nr:metalloregulator ArsR/SmtB family transcription factor [Bifidobacteriaceae bacterium]